MFCDWNVKTGTYDAALKLLHQFLFALDPLNTNSSSVCVGPGAISNIKYLSKIQYKISVGPFPNNYWAVQNHKTQFEYVYAWDGSRDVKEGVAGQKLRLSNNINSLFASSKVWLQVTLMINGEYGKENTLKMKKNIFHCGA